EDVKRLHNLAYTVATLPRNHKTKSVITRWKNTYHGLAESTRRTITIEKEDDESYGFELQTYGLRNRVVSELEMCTYVFKVKEEGPAERAGMKAGDILITINDSNVEGIPHKQIVDIIREAGNCLRIEVEFGIMARRMELQTRLQYLKQTMHEKCKELRSLLQQEQRLVHGKNASVGKVGLTDLNECRLVGRMRDDGPAWQCRHEVLSMSSLPSNWAVIAEDSDEAVYTTCLYGGLQDGGAGKDGAGAAAAIAGLSFLDQGSHNLRMCRSEMDLQQVQSQSLAGSMSTLPRKGKKSSLRRSLRRFIPGLNKTLEEEQTPF
uniref:Trafficking regulator and scaffold protein tamalin n=1 Tax=Petromyzon marinus TaxID=7757 RepID=S4R7A7_PETMA